MLRKAFLPRQLCSAGFVAAREERLQPPTPPDVGCLAQGSARAGDGPPCCLFVPRASCSSLGSALQSWVSPGLQYEQYLHPALDVHPDPAPAGKTTETSRRYAIAAVLKRWDRNLAGLLEHVGLLSSMAELPPAVCAFRASFSLPFRFSVGRAGQSSCLQLLSFQSLSPPAGSTESRFAFGWFLPGLLCVRLGGKCHF